jgi:hypothetical protein
MSDKIKIIRADKLNQIYLSLEENDLYQLISDLDHLKYREKYIYWDDTKNKVKIIFQNRNGNQLKNDNWEQISTLCFMVCTFILSVVCILGFVYTVMLGFEMIGFLFKGQGFL